MCKLLNETNLGDTHRRKLEFTVLSTAQISITTIFIIFCNENLFSVKITTTSELFIPILTALTMMTSATVIMLTAAMASTVSNAVTVMNKPLPFKIYKNNNKSECEGKPLGSGTITSVTAMGNGKFCEVTQQNSETGEKLTVFTKVDFTSCDAVEKGAVFIDAYVCADKTCSVCTDKDKIPVSASMTIPKFAPLPAADSCWGIEASTTGVTVLNQFDAAANADFVNQYWQVYLDNSCLKDTVKVVEKKEPTKEEPSTESAAYVAAPMAIVSSIGLVLATLLM